MKFPTGIPVFGDATFRGECRPERAEQIEFMSWLKFNHPDYRKLVIHHKNEGKRTFKQVAYESADGSINAGVSDIVIPGNPAFVIELKRLDHTKSRLTSDEESYLHLAMRSGCFAGIALGCRGLKEAFEKWIIEQEKNTM